MESSSFFVYSQLWDSVDIYCRFIMNKNIEEGKKAFVRPVVNVVELEKVSICTGSTDPWGEG